MDPSLGGVDLRPLEWKEECCVSRLRLYKWNEIVDSSDNGMDLVVLVLKNKFVVNGFPKKSMLRKLDNDILLRARNLMVHHGFIEQSSTLLLRDRYIPQNNLYPRPRPSIPSEEEDSDTLVSYSTWMDLVWTPTFATSGLKMCIDAMLMCLQTRVFLVRENIEKLAAQISSRIEENYLTSYQEGDPDSRFVYVVEIHRVVLTAWKYFYYAYGDLRGALPDNPFELVPVATYDPYSLLETETVYDQFRFLLTEPNPTLDAFCPEDEFGIIGFIRARLLSMFVFSQENESEVIADLIVFLKARFDGKPDATFPRYRISEEKPPVFDEVAPRWPHPSLAVGETNVCMICLEDLSYSDPIRTLAECNCPRKSDSFHGHIFHGHCLATWFSVSVVCPVCMREQDS